jgi:hypothetical protein
MMADPSIPDYSNIIIVEDAATKEKLTDAQIEKTIRDPQKVTERDPVTQALFLIGKTSDQKKLLVVLEFEALSQTWLVVFVRGASQKEDSLYREHAKKPPTEE